MKLVRGPTRPALTYDGSISASSLRWIPRARATGRIAVSQPAMSNANWAGVIVAALRGLVPLPAMIDSVMPAADIRLLLLVPLQRPENNEPPIHGNADEDPHEAFETRLISVIGLGPLTSVIRGPRANWVPT
jgi:hypothetical protein